MTTERRTIESRRGRTDQFTSGHLAPDRIASIETKKDSTAGGDDWTGLLVIFRSRFVVGLHAVRFEFFLRIELLVTDLTDEPGSFRHGSLSRRPLS